MDYLIKRGWTDAADAFSQAAKIPLDSRPPIDSPFAFLVEWWCVFWDIFAAKTNKAGTREAQLYLDARSSTTGI
jgi:hypothetical protein